MDHSIALDTRVIAYPIEVGLEPLFEELRLSVGCVNKCAVDEFRR